MRPLRTVIPPQRHIVGSPEATLEQDETAGPRIDAVDENVLDTLSRVTTVYGQATVGESQPSRQFASRPTEGTIEGRRVIIIIIIIIYV